MNKLAPKLAFDIFHLDIHARTLNCINNDFFTADAVICNYCTSAPAVFSSLSDLLQLFNDISSQVNSSTVGQEGAINFL
jgi:hypothetical protein